MITREKIQEIADKVAPEFQPEKIILFASFAWGMPTKDSDVYLFVVKEGEWKKWEKEKAVYKFLAGAKIPIDALVYTREEDIFTEGRTLYSAIWANMTNQEIFEEREAYALDDEKVAEIILREDGPPNPLCFHAQQLVRASGLFLRERAK